MFAVEPGTRPGESGQSCPERRQRALELVRERGEDRRLEAVGSLKGGGALSLESRGAAIEEQGAKAQLGGEQAALSLIRIGRERKHGDPSREWQDHRFATTSRQLHQAQPLGTDRAADRGVHGHIRLDPARRKCVAVVARHVHGVLGDVRRGVVGQVEAHDR